MMLFTDLVILNTVLKYFPRKSGEDATILKYSRLFKGAIVVCLSYMVKSQCLSSANIFSNPLYKYN